MNKQQWLLVAAGLATVAGLSIFGSVKPPAKKAELAATHADTDDHEGHSHSTFDMSAYQKTAVSGLSAQRQQYLASLEETLGKETDKEAAVHAGHRLAAFWRDSAPNPLLHFNFASRAAELDNSEKSLTFAAHSILGYLPYAQNQQELSWLADKGKDLFEEALKINPANDSSIVGAGACIIYGASAGDGGPMQGIMKVRDVAQRDSTNLFAQYMLGIGGMVSRQYDKAALRFEKVVQAQPNNLEALFKLAETNELMGNKPTAAKWYAIIAGKVKDPAMKAEIEKRIDELKR